jgi:DNA-directed RNA polymerase I subunit RPA2
MTSKVSATVQTSRAKVTKDFEDKLYEEREEDLQRFIQERRLSQHTPNIETADSQSMYDLVEPHVESMNWAFDEGMEQAIKNLPPILINPNPNVPNMPIIKYRIASISLQKPVYGNSADVLLPHQCRELGITYDAPMQIQLERQIEDGPVTTTTLSGGRVPIMVRSRYCHLQGLSRKEMVEKREEAGEWGGYFIINGNERLVRLLIMSRRNQIFGMFRGSFLKRGPEFSKYATTLRCVRLDQSASTITAHYLETGSVKVRITIRKQEFFIPAVLILKALVGMSDREIYEKITLNHPDHAFEQERTEMMLREVKELGLTTRNDVLSYLGHHFRLMLRYDAEWSDSRCGIEMLNEFLFIHVQDFAGKIFGTDQITTASKRSKKDKSPFDTLLEETDDDILRHNAINQSKCDLLILMIRKLFLLVQEKIKPDNVDALTAHEVLLPGHLYNIFLKEQLYDLLQSIRGQLFAIARHNPDKFKPHDELFWKEKVFNRLQDIGTNIRYLLVTGNLRSKTGLDLMQVGGYSVNAEKLNYWRYLSHFRAVHRGQFFTTMKTTAVRKLLPESWGFVCPVHTPDGSPCGLLNHLSRSCRLLTHNCQTPVKDLLTALYAIGMYDINSNTLRSDDLPVILDGIHVGKVPSVEAEKFIQTIRYLKVSKNPSFDQHLEIVAVSDFDDLLWPHVNLTTTTARFVRPVYYLPPQHQSSLQQSASAVSHVKPITEPTIEWIGAYEQLNMEIAVMSRDYQPGLTTHQEITPTFIFSVLASLTPFSDHNQSPRNMYQCQMGKQSMATPYHSHPYRTDNKVYRIQNPQTPIVRNEGPYRKYLLDEYPHGCNAVVAVISYTGYDMEDAMIINKSAYERGFGHGSVYKYKVVDLSEKKIAGEAKIHHHFDNQLKHANPNADPNNNNANKNVPSLDVDGLPHVGQHICPDEPLYSVYNDTSRTFTSTPFKDTEPAYIEEIRALNNTNNRAAEGSGKGDMTPEIQKVTMKLRLNRNPVIGDKFSSRHGQKGVLSILFPQIDMPWSESGISPDVIINPHAFPSRMTIGMLIESMAGKAGALHAKFQDGCPFQFDENNRAVDYFGQQLRAAGYNYLGSEPLYSGISGEPLMADIFFGVVYYQRLRHMVKDKFQARATGPINGVHRQPIKGRKVHGGIRFGEMERDSLIAHGVSFLLHDRLMNCSDYHTTFACRECGSLIAAQNKSRRMRKQPQFTKPVDFEQPEQSVSAPAKMVQAPNKDSASNVLCRVCNHGNEICVVAVPYVFMYLVNELAAMNIRMTLDIK